MRTTKEDIALIGEGGWWKGERDPLLTAVVLLCMYAKARHEPVRNVHKLADAVEKGDARAAEKYYRARAVSSSPMPCASSTKRACHRAAPRGHLSGSVSAIKSARANASARFTFPISRAASSAWKRLRRSIARWNRPCVPTPDWSSLDAAGATAASSLTPRPSKSSTGRDTQMGAEPPARDRRGQEGAG